MNPDLGVQGAKRKNMDPLMTYMRAMIAKHPDWTQSQCINAVFRQLDEAEIEDAAKYALDNIFRRCTRIEDITKSTYRAIDPEEIARVIKESAIRLWSWKVPTIGKRLPDCTFGELAEAAPATGRFLSRLSSQGAPGTLVREIFKNERELQEFWKHSQ